MKPFGLVDKLRTRDQKKDKIINKMVMLIFFGFFRTLLGEKSARNENLLIVSEFSAELFTIGNNRHKFANLMQILLLAKDDKATALATLEASLEVHPLLQLVVCNLFRSTDRHLTGADMAGIGYCQPRAMWILCQRQMSKMKLTIDELKQMDLNFFRGENPDSWPLQDYLTRFITHLRSHKDFGKSNDMQQQVNDFNHMLDELKANSYVDSTRTSYGQLAMARYAPHNITAFDATPESLPAVARTAHPPGIGFCWARLAATSLVESGESLGPHSWTEFNSIFEVEPNYMVWIDQHFLVPCDIPSLDLQSHLFKLCFNQIVEQWFDVVNALSPHKLSALQHFANRCMDMGVTLADCEPFFAN